MLEEKRDRVIVIDALSEREFEPDLFTLAIGFHGEHSEKKSCIEAYNADFAKVKTALENAGIQPDEIKNSEFRVTTHYDWLYEKADDRHDYYRRVSRLVNGYEYNGDCTVEHEVDPDLLKRIWAALQEIEGDFSVGIDYRLARPDECEKTILREAVAEARARAETLASAAGTKLGDVVTINHRFDNASSFGASGLKRATRLAPDGDFGSPPCAPEFNPRALEVSCSVSVAWALE